ncbi:hypothetical protein LQ567_03545 [Niabella pedocola]|uniref:DoxX family protein n=1 Tax=Niabella pedocola TaxID=1752077 RepID=A0ABS8PL58_9BACT|nr:hypothetical protein [Niabella pedocola]MCD2421820.1 hypothetical protein [Niabella pedocola]
MNSIEERYREAKSDKWFQNFAVFCRIALAASFLPSGYVKIMGQRFAEGLSHNNPLGRYFDALLATGHYYTFIGVTQVVIALLILIPRTALLGTLMYFCVIVNIGVLTYATRFHGTRIVTIMILACLYLLIWDYDRIKHILPFRQPPETPRPVKKPLGMRLRLVFFGGCIVALAVIIIGTSYLYEIVPGDSEAEARNQCPGSKNPEACEAFCDCIYKQGQPLESCLAIFNKAKDIRKTDTR